MTALSVCIGYVTEKITAYETVFVAIAGSTSSLCQQQRILKFLECMTMPT